MSEHEQHGPNASADFERDLEAVEAAWRRVSAEEPPKLVDQAVRNRARLELERGRPRRLRWIGHFATAGVVVLAVSLLLLQDWGPAPVPGDGELRLERAADEAAPVRESTERMMAPKGAPAAEPAEAPERRALNARSSPVAAPMAAPAAAQAVEPAALAEDAPAEARDPEGWIEELLALKAAGHTDELEAGLAAFRAAWPDHPLPPELAGD